MLSPNLAFFFFFLPLIITLINLYLLTIYRIQGTLLGVKVTVIKEGVCDLRFLKSLVSIQLFLAI